MKILYHDDMDGRAGAAVLLRSEAINMNAQCFPMDYARDVPFDQIAKDEDVIIVDFSLQKPGDWQRLLEITKNVVWLDHHKTAIEQSDKIPEVQSLKGIRSCDCSGCMLAWRWVSGEEEAPYHLQLISDRDTWTWAEGTTTAYFHAGTGMRDTKPESSFWDYIDGNAAALAEVLRIGESIVLYKQSFYSDLRESIGFPTEIDGHKAFALNVARAGSEGFGFSGGWKGELPDEWPILMPFYWDGSKFTISLYSKTIDVSEIAKKYGGGGHKGASGFQATELPDFLRRK